jgi:hypothetical protein
MCTEIPICGLFSGPHPYAYVNPQMGTNSVWKRGVPIWKYVSLPAHFHTGITIWER